MEEDSDENQEKHQAPENLHETSMARVFNEELKLAEIKIAFDAQNAEQVVKLPENCCMKAQVQKPTKSTNIVAVAINLFGPTSPAALAIAVGVLEASGRSFLDFFQVTLAFLVIPIHDPPTIARGSLWRDGEIFMPRKSTVTELDPRAEAAWRDFEKATKSSEPALIGVQKVSKMLGISKDALPAISDAGILSSIEIEGQKVERKFFLKQVVCMRSDLCSLEKMRKIEAGWVRKKNNSKPRKRDAAAGPEAPATLGA